MELYFYQAECGDAGRIRYIGSDNKPHNILIDGGYERTFRSILGPEIKLIKNATEKIDLFVVSHIHDDHIGGAWAYTKAIKSGEYSDIVESWMYNPPRHSLLNLPISYLKSQDSISEVKSIGQGDDLFNYLENQQKLPSIDFSDEVPPFDFFGLKITILSPSVGRLKKLRKKYSPSKNLLFERNEIDSISEVVARREHDYNIPLESFNLNSWKEDSSVENGSSISLLTELNDKRVLWLADAHPSNVVQSLKNLGYSESKPLECDYVKVTHHGSRGNNNDALYRIVKCSNYIISADGENVHALPNKECLARIIRNPNRETSSECNIYFTYDNLVIRKIFEVDGQEILNKWRVKLHYPKVGENYIYKTP